MTPHTARIRSAFLILTASVALGCGGKDPQEGGDAGTGDPSKPLLPWAEGYTWTYQVTDSAGVTTRKVRTIGALELVGGTGPNAATMANYVVTTKGDGTDETRSWQGPDGDRVVRYREQSMTAVGGTVQQEEHWEPSKLHIDSSAEKTAAGASWAEKYKETKIPAAGTPVTVDTTDLWTVVSPAESITVPAGTFTAVVFQKVGGTSTKRYWYVRGVGKVKETGAQTEELAEYDVE
jgi:hypothetical protein